MLMLGSAPGRRVCPAGTSLVFVCFAASSFGAATNTTYQYDELGRLRTVTHENVAVISYTYDAADNRTQKQVVMAGDTSAPTPPGSVTISNVTSNSAVASWSASTDNVGVAGYEFRLNSAPAWTNLGNWTSVELASLSAGAAYTFEVRAKDATGNTSSPQSATFTTFATVNILTLNVKTQYSGAGTASYGLTSAGAIVTSQPKSSSLVIAGFWLTPQSGMSLYEVLASSISSPACTGTVFDTWLSLSANRTWSIAAPNFLGGGAACAFNLYIRRAANPSVILNSAQISVTAVNAP